MSYSSPGTGPKAWHVVVFLGFVVLVVDLATIRMVGNKTNHFAVAPAPAPPPAADAGQTLTVPLPPGMKAVALRTPPGLCIGPREKWDFLAHIHTGGESKVFELLVDVLVVAVELVASKPDMVYPEVERASFALTDKQERALELARARGCTLTIKRREKMRTPEENAKYDLDAVIKLLEDLPEPLPIAPPPRPVAENR